MEFIIRFAVFMFVTLVTGHVYERRRANETITTILYFAVVAVVFLL